jgi:hypothetical protein
MKWNYTNLIIANLVFIISSGVWFAMGIVPMGFAFLACSVLVLLATMTAYLGNHIPTK